MACYLNYDRGKTILLGRFNKKQFQGIKTNFVFLRLKLYYSIDSSFILSYLRFVSDKFRLLKTITATKGPAWHEKVL